MKEGYIHKFCPTCDKEASFYAHSPNARQCISCNRYIHKPCPTCKKMAKYHFHSGQRSCLECQRTHYATPGDRMYDAVLDEALAEKDRKRAKAEREKMKRDQGTLDL